MDVVFTMIGFAIQKSLAAEFVVRTAQFVVRLPFIQV